MDQSANMVLDRDTAFALARLALARAHRRHIQVRQHRAINRVAVGPSMLLQVFLLPALFCGLLVWGQPFLFELWRDYILAWSQQLEIPLAANTSSVVAGKLGLVWEVANPLQDLPSAAALVLTALLTLAAFLASFAMTGRMHPLRYVVRILCAVQGLALVYFLLTPASFPYDVANHAGDLATMGYVIMLAIPVMLAVGYYVLNIALSTKILHTVMILLYFVVLVPFQIIAHVLILQHFSLLLMPLLYMCFGSLIDMLCFIALYSWAASNAPAKATT